MSERTLVLGIDLRLVATADGGRRGPLFDSPYRPRLYRPNWGLPSMSAPEQSGAPVLGLSADRLDPGGSARAVIAVLAPEMVERWATDVDRGTVLPMYEGPRTVGHGRVLWTRWSGTPVSADTDLRAWLDRGRPAPRMVAAVDSPAWLPAGSRAEVWADHRPPRPTGLVRLAIRQDDRVFCVPRDDGRWDLPTAPASADDPDGTVAARTLALKVLGPAGILQHPLGHVRNIVSAPDPDYPWPRPHAYFTVWSAVGTPQLPGDWLSLDHGSALRDRHWFPLLSPASG